MTLTVDLAPEGSHTIPGEAYQSITQAASTLEATLETKSIEFPVPVAQLWVAKDPHTPGPPPSLPNLRSRGAMGLYIVLCVLSGGECQFAVIGHSANGYR